jgi:integrase
MASIAKRRDGKWRARYRDPEGREHARHFDRKIDAEKWTRAHAGAVDRGDWINPAGAKRTVREYGEEWRKAQVHRPTTAAMVETHLRRHVYPMFGDKPMGEIRRSHVQAWVTGRSHELAPTTVRVVYAYLAAILGSAVEDRLIPASPCNRITLPKVQPSRVDPIPTDLVEILAAKTPDQYRALVTLGIGTGVRQGEAFGLTVDRIDFLRRTLTVDRQLVTMPGAGPYLAPPKTQASNRVIPLPQVVVDALAAHLTAYPAGSDGHVFTTVDGEPIRRTAFSYEVWRPAAKAALKEYNEALTRAAMLATAAGVTPSNAKAPMTITFHDLRHFYASLLIRHGESVKTVQARLGHATASETLETYSHLWPDSDDRTREAIDAVLGDSAIALSR